MRETGSAPPIGRAAEEATAWFVALIVLFLVLGGLTRVFVVDTALGEAEVDFVDWIARNRAPFVDELARVGSSLSDTWTVIGTAFGASVMLWAAGRRRHAAVLPVGLALELCTFLVVSYTIGRDRPDVTPLGSVPSTSSFPSGHVAAAVVLYGGLVVLGTSLTPGRRVSRLAVTAAVVAVTFVALARVYEGVHHPTDVLGGLLLGIGALTAASTTCGIVENGPHFTVGAPDRTREHEDGAGMIVVGAVVGIGALAGVCAGLVARRWHRADPTDPHVEDRTFRRFVREHPLIARVVRRRHPSPAPATAEALGLAALVVAAGSVAAGIVFVMVRTRQGIARVDTPLANWAADHATAAGTDLLRLISNLGGTGVVVIAALIVTAFELFRDRRAVVPAFVALVVGGQFLLANTIKLIVDRARPTIAPLTGFAGTSFPSGHAVAAAATWMCVSFLLGRRRGRHSRALLFGGAVATAVTVAVTRVALGVHWTTDVIAGLLIGWVWFATCAIAFGGRMLHFGEPVEEIEAAADEVGVSPAS